MEKIKFENSKIKMAEFEIEKEKTDVKTISPKKYNQSV